MDAIHQVTIGSGTSRRPPVPGAPLVEVLLGGEGDSPVGVLHVTVPPGGAMPEHDHGESTTFLLAVGGSARLVDVSAGERPVEVRPGTVTTIPVGRRVRLENPGEDEARLVVVLSPPDFARRAAAWPAAER
jgi:mannose-6-phosphate isomerase-like protein (cupin superfamily)